MTRSKELVSVEWLTEDDDGVRAGVIVKEEKEGAWIQTEYGAVVFRASASFWLISDSTETQPSQ